MKGRKIINGILALALTGSILLFSDLNNRISNKTKKTVSDLPAGQFALKGKKYRIGLTYFGPDAGFDELQKGMWIGLSELGFIKDSNLIVLPQHANGEMSNLQPIHLNMDNLNVDLIVVTSSPGISAAVATVKKHPMVFTFSYTPLDAGAGKSLTQHLPNITGVGSFPPVEKTIDYIMKLFPNGKRIGTLYNSSEINSRKVVEKAREYCKKIGIELIETTVTNTSEVYQGMSALCMRNIDAVWVTGDNTALQAFHGIVKACRDNKKPLIINDSDYTDDGALAAIGISWFKTGYRTAPYIARVLNGESPAGIPIENYVEETVTFNDSVARILKIKKPDISNLTTSESLKGKKFKFCLVHYIDSPNSEDAEKGIKDELKRAGFEEGTDFTLKIFNAQGDVGTLNSIADVIAGEKWDLIFVTSTPTIQTISKKINKTPVVFTVVGDPVRAGLGKSETEHLPNITGISTLSDFEGMILLVKEFLPGIKRIGTIFTPGEVNSVIYKDDLTKTAQNHGMTLIAVPANSASEVHDAALSLTTRNVQAFTQISDNLTASCGAAIIKAASGAKIPYFAFIGKQLNDGAVAAISRDYYYAGVDAAIMAQQVLDGTSPADIPFRPVSKTIISVNSDACRTLGIKVPENYLKNR